jgi:hypothetical protein
MRVSRICLCGLLTLVCADRPLRSSGGVPPDRPASVERFLTRKEVPLTSAVTRRHLVATTRGGAMSGWIDACTFLDGNEMRYEILAQGGSGAVRKRALIAALDGEVKARRAGDTARAAPGAGELRVHVGRRTGGRAARHAEAEARRRDAD